MPVSEDAAIESTIEESLVELLDELQPAATINNKLAATTR
jgi:hypothetical protein